MKRMGAFLGFFIMFLIAELLLLAVSIGIGYLLRLLIPSLDPGMAILISLAATIASVFMVAKLMSRVSDDSVMIIEDDAEDDEQMRERESGTGVYSLNRFSRRNRKKRRR
jgi:hypothetical protein